MKKKKIFYWALGLSIISFALVSSAVSFNNKESKLKLIDSKTSESYKVKILGAVKHEKILTFFKPIKIKELLKKVDLNSNADLTNISMNMEIKENFILNIPEQTQRKLLWKNIHKIEDLTGMKISKSLALKILKLRKEKINITWNDLKEVNGIGSKILENLQSKIQL
ncbi:MAG0490 family ComEA-like DNA-binding protein [Mycoplasmopsis columbina]|uniref:MAG0490 family ComEA-like DNA-binding protein n=1 Tax=Mycoplasmopsis columbina TaxID=114881 RepID=UPI0004A6BA0F|nr:hypothetical protein [Mycoplasmopsis columbina]VEU76733.1 Uncharacterised protein [Mycoplasmopsis columbina]